MAVIKAVKNNGKTAQSLKRSIAYTCNKDKAVEITGINGANEPQKMYEQMYDTKQIYGKEKDLEKGEYYKHFSQNFKPKETDEKTAHKIGVELANKLWGEKGFEVIVSTHNDKEHLHNHFIVNTTNFMDGKTIRINANKTLSEYKNISDDICRKNGLSVINKIEERKERKTGDLRTYNKDAYAVEKKGGGWTKSIAEKVSSTVALCEGKGQEKFKNELRKQGIDIIAGRSRSEITFVERDTGKKIRASTLSEKYGIGDISRENIVKKIGEFPKERRGEETQNKEYFKAINTLANTIDSTKRVSKSEVEFIQKMKENNITVKTKNGGGYVYYSEDGFKAHDTTLAKIKHNDRYLRDSVILDVTMQEKNREKTLDEKYRILVETKSKLDSLVEQRQEAYKSLNVISDEEALKKAKSKICAEKIPEWQQKKNEIMKGVSDLDKERKKLDQVKADLGDRPTGMIAKISGGQRKYDIEKAELEAKYKENGIKNNRVISRSAELEEEIKAYEKAKEPEINKEMKNIISEHDNAIAEQLHEVYAGANIYKMRQRIDEGIISAEKLIVTRAVNNGEERYKAQKELSHIKLSAKENEAQSRPIMSKKELPNISKMLKDDMAKLVARFEDEQEIYKGMSELDRKLAEEQRAMRRI